MENPATWGPVEHAINEAVAEHNSRGEEFIGLSLVRTIADKLREKGFVADIREASAERLLRFEDDVRDVMDHMPHDKHYDGLNAALARIRKEA